MRPSSPASRRSTGDAGSWRTEAASAGARKIGRRSHLEGQRPTPRARAARAGATELRSPLLRLRQAHLDRLGHRPSRFGDFGGTSRTSPRSISLRSRGPSGDGRWSRAWPRITRFEDRWRWLSMSVVPRFRKFDADSHVIDASLRRIVDEARVYASTPCLLPRASQNDNPQTRRGRGRLTLSWLGLN